MPHEIKAWKCSFCSRCYARKGTAVVHENACKKNPERRHCAMCDHGILTVNTLVTERLECELDPKRYAYTGPLCAYFGQPISEKPYFIECDTDEYYDGGERPVPGTCWNFENKGKFGWTPEDEYAKSHQDYQPEKAPDDGVIERMIF